MSQNTIIGTHYPRYPHSKIDWSFNPDELYTQKYTANKPSGFWLSFDNGWCETVHGMGEETWLQNGSYEFIIDLNKILVIDNLEKFDSFHNQYSVKYLNTFFKINWEFVALTFSGIIISPYQYSKRNDGEISDWYHTWDCASGCIWDLSVLTESDQ